MDDTTRGVGRADEFQGRGDETRGRGDERVRDYASTTPATSRTARTDRGSDADDDLDADSKQRARELESEIAHTRAEMSETIEAIQERLRPSNLVSDATERVKTATTEKVKSMADTASETAQDMMRGTRERAYDVVEGAKQNPIPALMIGAGVAWLLMDRSRNKNRGYNSGYRTSEWSQYSPRSERSYSSGEDYYRSADANYSDVDYNRQSTGQSTASRPFGYGSGYERESGWTESASNMMSETRNSARQTVRKTQNQLQRMLRDNPLLVGAAAVLAGAAVGASLPETERENQLMGEARDSMIDRAQEAARDAANTVKEVASDPVAVVGKVAEVVNEKKSS